MNTDLGSLIHVSCLAQGGGAFSTLLVIAIVVAVIAGFWRMFEKANQPGWGAIIPIYNIILLLQIAGKPVWWIILMMIPFVNIIPAILVPLGVAKNFGKSALFGIGLILLPFVFYLILGFGDAKYVPAAGTASQMPVV
jgi:hypothetical protein